MGSLVQGREISLQIKNMKQKKHIQHGDVMNFKEIFDDIDGDNRNIKPSKVDIHFMFAVVFTNKIGQTTQLFKIQLFNKQKDAEKFLVGLMNGSKEK
jgi:hypothetical protein